MTQWRDRFGSVHIEHEPVRNLAEPPMVRVVGPIETAWADRTQRSSLRSAVLAQPNPIIERDPEQPDEALWSWVVAAADAAAVLLWTNPVFDHADVSTAEMTRLEDSDLWTICLRLPAAMRASYRICVWRSEETPPWRSVRGRRPVLLAAGDASEVDPRGSECVRASVGVVSSVGVGPDAPRCLAAGSDASGAHTTPITLPSGHRAWVYAPPRVDALPTPLVLLFDGQVWEAMGLADAVDAAIARGELPALHLALLDSGDSEARWAGLGVPGAYVDVVLDELLPFVRSTYNVDPRAEATIIAGQSLGGVAALWALALGGDEIGHAIAQSPSLWRFAVAEPLLANAAWHSITLQAGTFEPDMLVSADALRAVLTGDSRAIGRSVTFEAFDAGHDWAAWRSNLLNGLRSMFRSPTTQQFNAEVCRLGDVK
ncbi:MAG: DUF3327 domain-containing protein [Microbacterium sp.]|jgi:enterochelin esterase family protein|nr:DUF3327 domain-containing protein [Microbacterium sp.]